MQMSAEMRDNIITSGPARFQLLSAFHPSFTSRQIHYLGPKLSIAFPKSLFETIYKVDIVVAHIKAFKHTDPTIQAKTLKI